MENNKHLQTVATLLTALGYSRNHIVHALRILSGELDINDKPLLTAGQLCRLLAISRTTLWRINPPFIRIGKAKRYDPTAVLASLSQNSNTKGGGATMKTS